MFGSVLACAKSAHVFQKISCSLCGLSLYKLITLPQTVRLFYVSLRSQASQQQYTIHCMHIHYDITLWAYLSEPLVKDSQATIMRHLITHYRYVCVTERYTET